VKSIENMGNGTQHAVIKYWNLSGLPSAVLAGKTLVGW